MGKYLLYPLFLWAHGVAYQARIGIDESNQHHEVEIRREWLPYSE